MVNKVDMKKRTLYIAFVFIIGLLFIIPTIRAQEDIKSKVENCQNNIKNPYLYNGYWMKDFMIDASEKKVVGHFIAFEGEKYQLVFCSSDFEEHETIVIYERNTGPEKKRKIVYENSQNSGNKIWEFVPTKSCDYFIEYTIPPSKTGLAKKAYVVLLIGIVVEDDAD